MTAIKNSMSTSYLIAVIVVVGFSIFGVIGYSLIAPEVGHTAFISFVGALSVPTTVALIALIRTDQQAQHQAKQNAQAQHEAKEARAEAREDARIAREEARRAKIEAEIAKVEAKETRDLTKATHKLVNSQLEEFKANIEELATARGFEAGMQRGREEADARTDALYTGQESVIHHEGTIIHEDAPDTPDEEGGETRHESSDRT